MSDGTVTDLLERLSSGRVDDAWDAFLTRYAPLIMHVIRRQLADEDRATDCFVHVCGALSDDNFHRLRSFRCDGPASFKSWLVAVVANLSIDWRRKERGRARPPRCVARLPELDQQVYRRVYMRGMSRAQCVEELAPRYPGLTEAGVAEINARLFALLTPHQRWQLSARGPASRPVACGEESGDDDPALHVAGPGPGPEDLAASLQEQRRLREALAQLPAAQRLLLRLRYEQDLTLAEVARLTGHPDPFRANRKIQSALADLADLLAGRQTQSGRKT
jgi:RNA polymerase sigma factor (sigma-70 family)